MSNVPSAPFANLLLVVPGRDISFVTALQSTFNRNFQKVSTMERVPRMQAEISIECKRKNCNFVATTSLAVMKLLDPDIDGTHNDNLGLVRTFISLDKQVIRVVLLPPIVWMFTVPHGHFLIGHYLDKLRKGGQLTTDLFDFTMITPENADPMLFRMYSADIISVDIETHQEGIRITSVAYTAGWFDAKAPYGIRTETGVIRCDQTTYPWCISLMRQFNQLPAPKVMQNGQYDATYFLRFNAPLRNWLFDTYNMFHAMFPELPRDIGFMSGFFLDNFRYWKEEAGRDLYQYNAKDTHNTLWVWLGMIRYCQRQDMQYAHTNYLIQFPRVFPALHSGLEGILAIPEKQKELHDKYTQEFEGARAKLDKLLGTQGFNPGSWQQVKQAMLALNYRKEGGTDEKALTAMKEANALYEPFVDAVLEYRGGKKAVSTYLEVELLNGRLMYQIDPSGTETGRASSKASNFWVGTQIQNIPPYARAMFRADPGWVMFEVDKAQAESYCTGFLSQDANLLHTLATSPDFHCTNASLFFGVPFDQLYDVLTKKVLRKDIRTVAKRVNHGANYNMGAYVLLTTMGTKAVMESKRLLNLPAGMSLLKVCEYLLWCFDQAYPDIRNRWYQELVKELETTGKLVLPNGWTRRTFLRPRKNKPELNSMVAHKPQGLSVMLVNEGWQKVWREMQLGRHQGNLRIKAQIHDALLGQVRIGHEHIVQEIADALVIPIQIEGRTMVIPSTIAIAETWDGLKD